MVVRHLHHHHLILHSEVLTDEIPKNTPKLREEVQMFFSSSINQCLFLKQQPTHQVQMWLKHKKIQGFYDVLQVCDCFQDDVDDDSERNFNVVVFLLQNRSFAEGADACISLRLTKISPPFNISPQESRLLKRNISSPVP